MKTGAKGEGGDWSLRPVTLKLDVGGSETQAEAQHRRKWAARHAMDESQREQRALLFCTVFLQQICNIFP
jgi:hypothetical protein